MEHTPSKGNVLLRALRKVVWLVGILYLALCAFMALFQRALIYHPTVVPAARVDQMAQAARLVRWHDAAHRIIGFQLAASTAPPRGSVLILHGNAGSATGSSFYAETLRRVAPFDAYLLEYPAFQDRPGSPSEQSLFKAAAEALQALPTNAPVYVVGESLGSGVAAYLAGTFPDRIAGLLLLSPFNDLASVGQYQYPMLPVRLLLRDRFPSATLLRNYHGPVAVVVDGRDTVVPEQFGLRLYEGYAGPKWLWRFPNGVHTQIMAPPEVFWSEVVAFWQNPGAPH